MVTSSHRSRSAGSSSSSAATATSASSGSRSSTSQKRSTGSSSATSGRSSSSEAAAISASSRCSGPSSAAGSIETLLDLLQRALGEGGEEREPLDLDVEELAAHRPLLGGGIDVHDVAAQGELAALLHLVGALVSGRHELLGGLLEVEQPALLDPEPVRAKVGVGHLLRQRARARHHHGGAVSQRVQRGDAQADEMRRRREVRLVLHPSSRIEVHGPRREELLHVGGQVARRAVVARHDQRRAARARRRAARRAGTGRRLAETKARWGAVRDASARASTAGSSCAYVSSCLSSSPDVSRGP